MDLSDTAIFMQFYSPESVWCPGSAPTGGNGPMGESGEADGDYPTVDELYELLEASCLENHIPYT